MKLSYEDYCRWREQHPFQDWLRFYVVRPVMRMWRNLKTRIKAFLDPWNITASHAYAIGQTCGRVRSDDPVAIARLQKACDGLNRRYPTCHFHVEAEYPDASWTSIYGDSNTYEEGEALIIDFDTGEVRSS